MSPLRAVEPNGRSVVDDHGIGGDLSGTRWDKLETGEETRGVGHDVIDGDAGLSESGLGYGMVLSSVRREAITAKSK